jgi:hypothetical protein
VVVGVIVLRDQGFLPFLNRPAFQNRATLVLDSVQQMSVLTTTRYNFSSLITSERDMPPVFQSLYGERQVLVAVGAVTAGIDLSQMTAEDVVIRDNAVLLTLPPPALQDCFLDESASYVVERSTGLFAQGAPQLEGQARQFAIQQFREGALNSGIFENVQQQATEAITTFVQLLQIPDITTVSVQVPPPDLDAPLPTTCQ